MTTWAFGEMPSSAGHLGLHRADDRARLGTSGGSRRRSTPDMPHQHRVVGQRGRGRRLSVSQAAVIDIVRGRGDPGEAHGQVVDRLEVPARPGRATSGRSRSRCSMWPTGSSPVGRRDAAGPAHPGRERAGGRSPATGPPTTARGVLAARGCRSTSRTRRPGRPSSSTGTVLAHWPVTATPTTSRAVDAALGEPAPGGRDDRSPPGRGVLDRGPAGHALRRDALVPPPQRCSPRVTVTSRPSARRCPGRRRGRATAQPRSASPGGTRLLGVEHVGP